MLQCLWNKDILFLGEGIHLSKYEIRLLSISKDQNQIFNAWRSLALQNRHRREFDTHRCLCWSQPVKHSCTHSIKAHEWSLGVNSPIHAPPGTHTFTAQQRVSFNSSFRLPYSLQTLVQCQRVQILRVQRTQQPLNSRGWKGLAASWWDAQHCAASCLESAQNLPASCCFSFVWERTLQGEEQQIPEHSLCSTPCTLCHTTQFHSGSSRGKRSYSSRVICILK